MAAVIVDHDPGDEAPLVLVATAEPIGAAEAELWDALDIDPELHPSAAAVRRAGEIA